MTFDWQLLITLAIVAVAAFYVARSFWRSLHPKSGSCGGCGCSKPASGTPNQGQLISSQSIQLRRARSSNNAN
jgi:hypothetical protein